MIFTMWPLPTTPSCPLLLAARERDMCNCKWTQDIARFVERGKTTASICILYFWSSGTDSLQPRRATQVRSSWVYSIFVLYKFIQST
jgi:hypothetical protein